MQVLLLVVTVPFWGIFQQEAGPRAAVRAAQIRQESGFKIDALSPVGARGLGQHMPKNWTWYQELGWVPTGSDPWDSRLNIRATDRFMCWLEARFSRDQESVRWRKSLAAYNGGESRVRRAEKRVKARGLTDTPGRELWVQELPKESQDYQRVIPEKHLPWVFAHTGGA